MLVSTLKRFVPNRIKHRINTLIHLGNNVQCPICKKSFRDWYALGVDADILKRYNVSGAGYRRVGCWNCHSNDRSRLLYLYFKDVAPISSKVKRVLHIAPNAQVSALFLNDTSIDYIRGDKFAEGYAYPEGVQFMDLLKLDFVDNSFDLLICNHVLEHIPEDTKAMSQIFRVLKPGGKAILQVPFSKKLDRTMEDPSIDTGEGRERAFGQFDHVRLYGADYVERLESTGLKVECVNLYELRPEYRRYGINPDEDVFVATKP